MRFEPTPNSHRLAGLLAVLLFMAGCDTQQSSHGGHGHPPVAEEDYERGLHNGRILRDGDFALEITIFETGVPPEFRVYPYRGGAPVDPRDVNLTIDLGRLGGRVERFEFEPQDDSLRGNGVVLEPHSFDVTVKARSGGRDYEWTYDSYEGRTEIDARAADAMSIGTAVAGPASIRETITVQGTLNPDPDAVSEVRGRFSGLVQSLSKSVGDTVREGEQLARIQSNESLQSYTITAPVSGTVIARHASVGSMATDDPIYVIADTTRLVGDLKVFSRDLARVEVGQAVTITNLDGGAETETAIERILPTIDPGSRAATVRTLVDNAGAHWRPGQFVRGVITVAATDAPLAVQESALQTFRDFTVVYARVDDTYEVRMLDLGRRDGEYVEVLGGLEPGTEYVTENSYLIKADIEKSGASHDH
ncbi:MAG TPA: efflux RND transporter periplasmic adaptor subunit [Woeseiaceae bacterium]|nr:efflux RND transporter periplasmic adaptor subunit [Woeseiaceae bacterium]